MAGPEWLSERERRAWSGFLTMREDLRRHVNRQSPRDCGLSEADYAVPERPFAGAGEHPSHIRGSGAPQMGRLGVRHMLPARSPGHPTGSRVGA
jgi:hypothetical protein